MSNMSEIRYSAPSDDVIRAHVARAEAIRTETIIGFIRAIGRSIGEAFTLIERSVAASRQAEALGAMSDRDLSRLGMRRQDVSRAIAEMIGVGGKSVGSVANANLTGNTDTGETQKKAA